MNKRSESLKAMTQLANRLGMIIVDMQVRKAQMLARGDTSPKNEPKK